LNKVNTFLNFLLVIPAFLALGTWRNEKKEAAINDFKIQAFFETDQAAKKVQLACRLVNSTKTGSLEYLESISKESDFKIFRKGLVSVKYWSSEDYPDYNSLYRGIEKIDYLFNLYVDYLKKCENLEPPNCNQYESQALPEAILITFKKLKPFIENLKLAESDVYERKAKNSTLTVKELLTYESNMYLGSEKENWMREWSRIDNHIEECEYNLNPSKK
jgi:hypothetical protein